jgi:cytochrome c553
LTDLNMRGILRLKTASPYCFAVASFVFAAALAVAAQTPPPPHVHPPAPVPTNLQVLPKTMTGEQVHELMHKWEAALGTECSTCHAADPTRKAPNGRPMLNFADDSKPEKATARLMFRMVEEINTQYVSKVDNSGMPVSCGTCHRGHLEPEPFVPPPDHDHDHEHHEAPAATPK